MRFLGPQQLELVSFAPLIEHNPGGRPWDAGLPSVLHRRQLLTVSPDGSKFESESEPEWFSLERQAYLQKLFTLPGGSGKLELKAPVSGALRAKAQKACGMSEPLPATHHECPKEAGSCMLVLGGKPDEPEQQFCFVVVKGQEVRALPLEKLVPSVDQFSLGGAAYCLVSSSGGIRGQSGDEQCISRTQPGRMAFVETKGAHLESADGYPVRKAASVAEGLQLAPTVHAFTAAHVSWGRDTWRDEKDLALTWQATRVGDTVHFHVEVTDDVLAPLGKGSAIHSDHLELDFWPSSAGASQKKGPHLKLGALLAEGGQVQLRVWKRGKDGKERNVDEAYAAKGTWTRTAQGYTVDLALPVEPLRKELAASRAWGMELRASDADEGGRQKALLGTQGALPLWNEYPPAIEEYARAYPRE